MLLGTVAKFRLEEVRNRGIDQEAINPLTPNDPCRVCTAPLASTRCILYIYSTNIVTEHFKRGIYSPFFPLQNAVCFIILNYLVPVLFTFYVQDVLKLKENNSGAKRLSDQAAASKHAQSYSSRLCKCFLRFDVG